MTLPIFSFRNRRYFGVSIGKTALRAIEVDKNNQVVSFAEIPISEDMLDDGVINKEGFIEALKQLVQKGKFSTPYVSVCFPESYAYVREYTFPQIKDADIHEALSWQLKDIFPFPPEEIHYDWKIIKKDANETDILIVAAQKKLLEDFTHAFNTVGLRPISFAPSASVLSPLMSHKESEIIILIEINRRGSMATIVDHKVSFLTTTTAFSPNDQSYAVSETIRSVKELLAYYTTKKKFPIKNAQILLSGEAATEQVVGITAQSFSYPVQLLTLPGIPPAYHKTYAAAVGRFCRPEDMGSINLLPNVFQTFYDWEELFERYKKSMGIAIGLLVIGIIMAISSFGSLFIQRQGLEQEIKQLNAMLERAGFNRNHVTTINSQANSITRLFLLKKTPESAIGVLYELVPDGVVITNTLFTTSSNTLVVSGTADNREDILVFRERLAEQERFEKIDIPLSSFEHAENVNFSLTIELSKE